MVAQSYKTATRLNNAGLFHVCYIYAFPIARPTKYVVFFDMRKVSKIGENV